MLLRSARNVKVTIVSSAQELQCAQSHLCCFVWNFDFLFFVVEVLSFCRCCSSLCLLSLGAVAEKLLPDSRGLIY